MLHNKKKFTGLIFLLILFNVHPIYSGPPFDTDDPEPVSLPFFRLAIRLQKITPSLPTGVFYGQSENKLETNIVGLPSLW
jgi:hypothetical protein